MLSKPTIANFPTEKGDRSGMPSCIVRTGSQRKSDVNRSKRNGLDDLNTAAAFGLDLEFRVVLCRCFERDGISAVASLYD